MRFIGNNHAIHFGGVTFVNRVTLATYTAKAMSQMGKSDEQQRETTRIIAGVVDQMEEELREELQQKHYHHDLHVPGGTEK